MKFLLDMVSYDISACSRVSDSVDERHVALKLAVACRAVPNIKAAVVMTLMRATLAPGANRLNFQRLCPHVNHPSPYLESKIHPVDSFGPCAGIMKL